MPTFDGDNLVMTLDAITSQDVIDSWYEPWKDWMLSSPINRGYPQLFISEGGGPVDATQSQGAYIRVNNSAGWRIRPPEQNIEIIYTGSLLRVDDNLPIFIPTIGSFSTQVFNIQPITTIVESTSNLTAAGVWSEVLEGSMTAEGMMRIFMSILAGKASGLDTLNPVFRDMLDTKDRVTAVTDANGNRPSVTLDES